MIKPRSWWLPYVTTHSVIPGGRVWASPPSLAYFTQMWDGLRVEYWAECMCPSGCIDAFEAPGCTMALEYLVLLWQSVSKYRLVFVLEVLSPVSCLYCKYSPLCSSSFNLCNRIFYRVNVLNFDVQFIDFFSFMDYAFLSCLTTLH